MRAGEVAAVLSEIALLTELAGEGAFRARAWSAAARALEGSGVDLEALDREDALTTLPGVGEGIAGTIRELLRTGRSGQLDRLRAEVPAGLHDLLRLPGLGVRKVRALHDELGIDGLDALERAAREGKVEALSGFGAKTVARMLEGIDFARSVAGRRRYPRAMEVAGRVLEWLRGLPEVSSVSVVGALRRRCETADGADLLAATDAPDTVLAAFRAREGGDAGGDPGRASVRLADGFALRLRCVPPDRHAAASVWETGSDEHLRALASRAEARGLALGPGGLTRDGEPLPLGDEAALYRALDLAYVVPELREGRGEVAAAAEGRLPDLVHLDDLRGTFHCHTTWSDGKATVAEMAEGARARGWSYLGLADHSRSASYAGGLSPAAVRKQHREIDAWNREHGGTGPDRFRLFKGIESDILPDGRLDYDDDVLASFDYVVGSVHSSFGMSRRAMTERIVRAVSHPRLTILGHPTGRLLLSREPYEVDVEAVLDAAAERGVAVEINADPHRLDLDWRRAREAAERGILLPVNPDAHSVRGMDNVAFGVAAARKGWLEPRHVLNCMDLDRIEDWFAERKQARA